MSAVSSWWTSIAPNLEASLLWALPGFTVHHLLMRRHNEAQTRQIKDHIDRAIQASPVQPDIKITLGGAPTRTESEQR